jgi:putative DNA primase/helicase
MRGKKMRPLAEGSATNERVNENSTPGSLENQDEFLDPPVRPDGKRLDRVEVTPETIVAILKKLPAKLDSLHYSILRTDSSISPEIMEKRGYRSITADKLAILKWLGFSEKHGCGLLIPVRDIDGNIVSCQVRFDRPVMHEDPKTGKRKKLRYLSPSGMDLRVDFPDRPLPEGGTIWIVEGMKKADSLRSRGIYAIAIIGVWGAVGKQARKDLNAIEWADREVIVCFDSDVASNPHVRKAEGATVKLFEELGATVYTVRLPDAPDGTKTGVDDFLAGGGTLDDLMALIEEPEPDWKSQLVWSETTGALKVNSANLTLILQNDERFKDVGAVAYDLFENVLVLDGKPVTDHLMTEIGAKLELTWKLSAIRPELLRDVLVMLGRRNSFHPVQKWLRSLAWDGIPRVNDMLHRYFRAQESRYSQAVSCSLMLSSVARVLNPGSKVDTVVILRGPQGCGKSSAIRTLFGDDWTGVPTAEIDSKDFTQFLHSGVWAVELAELSNLRSSEVEVIKRVVTCQSDRFRPPYGRTQESLQRQCIFIGTTNADAFLKDATGNRRFLPVLVGSIDLEGLRRDRDQLFAEAVARYQKGETWHEIPWEEAEAEREAVFEADAWEEKIGPWLSTKFPQETTVSEILEDCLGLPPDRHGRSEQTRVGNILRRWNWRSRQVRSGEGRIRVYSPSQPDVVTEVVTRCDSGVGAGWEQPSQPKSQSGYMYEEKNHGYIHVTHGDPKYIGFTKNGCDVVTVVPSEDQSQFPASQPSGTTYEVVPDDIPVEDI